MMKVLLLTTVAGVISPTSEPSSTRQYFGSPSHPDSVRPSKIGWKPGSSPRTGVGRSLCWGTYGGVSTGAMARARPRASSPRISIVISSRPHATPTGTRTPATFGNRIPFLDRRQMAMEGRSASRVRRLLGIACLWAAAAPLVAQPAPADLLLVGGRVYTFAWDEPAPDGTPAANAPRAASGLRPDAEALAIRGDRIVFVGTSRESQLYRGPKTRVIDVRGAT